jgi:hypothetical protein
LYLQAILQASSLRIDNEVLCLAVMCMNSGWTLVCASTVTRRASTTTSYRKDNHPPLLHAA